MLNHVKSAMRPTRFSQLKAALVVAEVHDIWVYDVDVDKAGWMQVLRDAGIKLSADKVSDCWHWYKKPSTSETTTVQTQGNPLKEGSYKGYVIFSGPEVVVLKLLESLKANAKSYGKIDKKDWSL